MPAQCKAGAGDPPCIISCVYAGYYTPQPQSGCSIGVGDNPRRNSAVVKPRNTATRVTRFFLKQQQNRLEKRRKKTTTPKLEVWLARFLIGFWMRGNAKRLRGGRSHTHWATKVAWGYITPATTCGCQCQRGLPRRAFFSLSISPKDIKKMG